jgi:hypothetical protein
VAVVEQRCDGEEKKNEKKRTSRAGEEELPLPACAAIFLGYVCGPMAAHPLPKTTSKLPHSARVHVG